jgi:hypothetical protein
LLFDQFHSLNYPQNGFIWKDTYQDDDFGDTDPFEWTGDHIFTNMQGLYTRLTQQGYYVEVAASPLTCIDLDSYAALLLIDIEDYLSRDEIERVRYYVEMH